MEAALALWATFDANQKFDQRLHPDYVGLLTLAEHVNIAFDDDTDGDFIALLEDALAGANWPVRPTALDELAQLRAGRPLDNHTTGCILDTAISYAHCDFIEAFIETIHNYAEYVGFPLYYRYDPRLDSLYPRLIQAVPPTTDQTKALLVASPPLLRIALPFLPDVNKLEGHVGRIKDVATFLELREMAIVKVDPHLLFIKHENRFGDSLMPLMRLLATEYLADDLEMVERVRARGLYWAWCASNEEQEALINRCVAEGVPEAVCREVVIHASTAVRPADLTVVELQDIYCHALVRQRLGPLRWARGTHEELFARARRSAGFM